MNQTSCLVVSLPPGRYQRRGIFRPICNLEDIELVGDSSELTSQENTDENFVEIDINNDAMLKITGCFSLASKKIKNGTYEVYDSNHNALFHINVKGLKISGLKQLFKYTSDQNFKLIFNFQDKIFSLEVKDK